MSNELFDELCEVMADVTGDMSYLPDEVLAAICEDEHYTVKDEE